MSSQSVRIRGNLLEDLDALAAIIGISRAELVNYLIREHLSTEAERINKRRETTAKAIGNATK